MWTHFFSSDDASTVQGIDVLSALVHEATYEAVVTEDDTGHLCDVLMALVLSDVATVIHQAGHQIAFTSLLICTFFNLGSEQNHRFRITL